MRDWQSQQPFTVTDEHMKARWGGGFHCKLCGIKFQVGLVIRWVYCNSTPGQQTGNFFVCSGCDGDDVKQRAKESLALATKLAKQWGIYGPDWTRDY